MALIADPKLRVQRYIDPAARGFYVEAGAHDGIGDSQTLWLEKAGWPGICVEPSRAYDALTRQRSCMVDNRVLWRADGKDVDFIEVVGTELSGLPEYWGDKWDRAKMEQLVLPRKTVRLDTLLREYGAPHIIDLFVLDTEGSELEILQTNDWRRWKFRYVLCEHNRVESRQKETRAFMDDHGYNWEPDDGGNDDLFWHPELCGKLTG